MQQDHCGETKFTHREYSLGKQANEITSLTITNCGKFRRILRDLFRELNSSEQISQVSMIQEARYCVGSSCIPIF
jgi:hypothetical protein